MPMFVIVTFRPKDVSIGIHLYTLFAFSLYVLIKICDIMNVRFTVAFNSIYSSRKPIDLRPY